MALKDLSGKSVYDLDPEDFEKLFCQNCKAYYQAERETARNCPLDVMMPTCRHLINRGTWDRYLKKPA